MGNNIQTNLARRIAIIALVWLFLISGLHFLLNFDIGNQKVITLGYMPVITNIAAPLLDNRSRDNEHVYFKALKFSSFAEMAEALRHSNIQAAFIIAPLSIVLKQQGEKVKVIYIGNRHESTLVARTDLGVDSIEDLTEKTVAVPMRYSGHYLALLHEMDKRGLNSRINIVEMNPPDMASALATGSLEAYFVGEPFAAQTVITGDAKVVNHVEDLWQGFICNLLLVRQDFVEQDPDIVQLLVQEAVRAGLWAKSNPQQAAEIVSRYWNQPLELVTYAMTNPENRIIYDQFVPKSEEIQLIADLMVRYGLIEHKNISGLVDDRFARNVYDNIIESQKTTLPELTR